MTNLALLEHGAGLGECLLEVALDLLLGWGCGRHRSTWLGGRVWGGSSLDGCDDVNVRKGLLLFVMLCWHWYGRQDELRAIKNNHSSIQSMTRLECQDR